MLKNNYYAKYEGFQLKGVVCGLDHSALPALSLSIMVCAATSDLILLADVAVSSVQEIYHNLQLTQGTCAVQQCLSRLPVDVQNNTCKKNMKTHVHKHMHVQCTHTHTQKHVYTCMYCISHIHIHHHSVHIFTAVESMLFFSLSQVAICHVVCIWGQLGVGRVG